MTTTRPVPTLRRGGATVCIALTLALPCASRLAAQELPYHRDHPGSGPYRCPDLTPPVPASAAAAAQAAELASASDQAVILGDLPRAAALLVRGVELDPASASLAYRRARVFEDLGEIQAATGEYCRALALAAPGDGDEWRTRLEALGDLERASLAPDAVSAFQAGLAAADAGHLPSARISFARAVARAPGWADAAYNHGVTLSRLGYATEGASALLRYLELRPDAPDALAVARRVGQLQSPARARRPRPVVAAAVGTLVPGMGQLYTGRPAGGITVFLIAGGAAAAGYFIQEVDVRCLTSVPAGTSCPPAEVVSRESDRPYLSLGLGAAGVVGILAAAEAFFAARGGGGSVDGGRPVETASLPGRKAEGPSFFAGPSVYLREGRIEVAVLSVR